MFFRISLFYINKLIQWNINWMNAMLHFKFKIYRSITIVDGRNVEKDRPLSLLQHQQSLEINFLSVSVGINLTSVTD